MILKTWSCSLAIISHCETLSTASYPAEGCYGHYLLEYGYSPLNIKRCLIRWKITISKIFTLSTS